MDLYPGRQKPSRRHCLLMTIDMSSARVVNNNDDDDNNNNNNNHDDIYSAVIMTRSLREFTTCKK